MRLIIENAEKKLSSIIQSIKMDKDSWEAWKCLRIETPELEHCADRSQVQFNINLMLDTHLHDREGSIIFCDFDEIVAFVKDISETLLSDIGAQIAGLAMKQSQQPVHFRVFNLITDHNHLADIYPADRLMEISSAEHMNALLQDNFHYPSLSGDRHSKQTMTSGKRVLLVEDDPVTRWIVRTALKDECDLATAPEADRALALYQSFQPDMVLLDINLPGKSGKDILVDIMKADPGAFVVMFSSHDSLDNIVEAMEQGARGFMAKPFRKERLLQYIENCPNTH